MGVSGLGRTMTVLPVSSAGTNFHNGVCSGKLYAAIALTTPIGS